jgi:hypothetical protein
MEEGFMLVFPELVLEGEVPNRDFLHLYGPGGLWVLALVYAAFGTSLASERVVGFAQHLGVAFGVYALIRPWGPWVAAGGGAIAAVIILIPHGLTALAWVGAVALALWAVRAGVEAMEAQPGSPRRTRQAAIAGLLTGAALLYRLDLLLALGLALAVVLAGLDGRGRKWLGVGLGIGLMPYLVHVATAGLRPAFEGMVLQPLFDLRGGRGLPLPPSWDHHDGFLQRAFELLDLAWPFPAASGPAQVNLWLWLLLAALVTLVVAGVRAARRGERRLLAIALFATGLLPQALQRADTTHLAWVSCVALGVLPAALVELGRSRTSVAADGSSGRSARFVGAVGVAVPVLLMAVLIPYYTFRTYADTVATSFGQEQEVGTMRNGDRTFLYGRDDAVAAVNALLPAVERVTDPGDRLFVGSGDLRKTPYSEAYLYFLLPELEPGTRYVEMDPGVANAEDSGLADEVAAADVVILSSIRDNWEEPNDSAVFGPDEPNKVVALDFCLVDSFGEGVFGGGLFELYVRC